MCCKVAKLQKNMNTCKKKKKKVESNCASGAKNQSFHLEAQPGEGAAWWLFESFAFRSTCDCGCCYSWTCICIHVALWLLRGNFWYSFCLFIIIIIMIIIIRWLGVFCVCGYWCVLFCVFHSLARHHFFFKFLHCDLDDWQFLFLLFVSFMRNWFSCDRKLLLFLLLLSPLLRMLLFVFSICFCSLVLFAFS